MYEVNLSKRRLPSNQLICLLKPKHGMACITSLDLSFNRLQNDFRLPAGLAVTLQRLRISHSHLKSVNFLNDLALNHLKYLDMSFNNIKSIDELGFSLNLPCLTELKLQGNQIRVIPKSIEKLQSLEILVLGNFIAGNLIFSIPDELSLLVNLRFLYMDHNHLTDFPECAVKLPTLEGVYLNHNRIRNLRSDFTPMTSLETVSLAFNRIRTIPESLKLSPKLEHLDLTGNKISVIPKAAQTNVFELALNPCFYNLQKQTVIKEVNSENKLRALAANVVLNQAECHENGLPKCLQASFMPEYCLNCPLRYVSPYCRVVEPSFVNGHSNVPMSSIVCSSACSALKFVGTDKVMLDEASLNDLF